MRLKSLLLVVLFFPGLLRAETSFFDMVTVGDVGEGSVDYAYSISRTEVTVSHYTHLLNSVAKTDLYGLFSTSMSDAIMRAGSSGEYSYSVNAGWENRPITYVTWTSAARFTNWLHNGQPIGLQSISTTEYGAYDMSVPNPLENTSRENDARWALPTNEEWIKAGYYDPTKDGIGGFWQYPTRNDSPPTAEAPPGGVNSTNYTRATAGTVDVGSYPDSIGYYGTLDQVGNVWELMEDIFNPGSAHDPIQRTRRGDSFTGWFGSGSIGHSVGTGNNTPNSGDSDTGFRVVQIPEPSSLILLSLGAVILSRRKTN